MKRLLLLVLLLLGFTAQAQNSFYYQPGPTGPMKILLLDNADGTYSIGMSASGGSGTPTYYYVQGPLGPMKVKLIDQGEGAYRIATAQTAGLTYKGAIDCSANPNYPAANSGDLYKVSVSGKIGGASGTTVSAGDTFFCTTDSTAAGNEATVGSYWVHMVASGSAGSGTVTNTSGNLTASALMVGNGGADSKVLASLGTTTTVLHGNAAGLPTWGAVAIGSDVSGLGTGVATFLGTPSSANLAAALTDETGTGAAVFATSPSLTTPSLGVATATSINKVAITAPATGSTLTIADGATLTASATASVSGTNNGGANPTASIGLTAVNGTANTFLRSDGAPALDQTIAPTWTSVHTFQQAVAATSTDGLVLATSATATSGNQKYSPRARFRGSYFSGSAKSTDWTIDNRPTASGGLLAFMHSDNGAAYATAFTVSPGGTMLLGGATDPGYSAGSLGSAATIYSADVRCRDGGGNYVYMAPDVFNIKSTNRIAFTNGDAGGGTADTFMYRAAAADLRFGAAAANPPVAQTLSVQDASGTDIAGATWTFRASRGTGAGAVTGKAFSWQTPDVGSTGTTLQTATEKWYMNSTGELVNTLPVAATSTDGIVLATSATATSGNQKWSPALHFTGSGWKTPATAGAQSVDWKIEVKPTQSGDSTALSALCFSSSVNGGAYTERVAFMTPYTAGAIAGVALGGCLIDTVTHRSSDFQVSFGTGASGSYTGGATSFWWNRADGFSVNSGFTLAGYGFSTHPANAPHTGVTYGGSTGNIRLGYAAANPPVAQTLSVQDASGTDIAGATWTFRGSRGTGAAAVTGKSFSWQTPDAGSTGTTLQTATEKLALTGDGNLIQSTVNGAQWIRGQASELLTLSTSGTTTDTSANLLPANSIIEAVVARVTTTITTATDWKLGDATTAGRFSAANSTMTAGTTQVGLVHVDQTGAAGPKQTSAAKVRVTTTGTPGAGAIRITVFYRQFVAPVSALIPVQKPFEMPSATRWSDLGRAA